MDIIGNTEVPYQSSAAATQVSYLRLLYFTNASISVLPFISLLLGVLNDLGLLSLAMIIF